MSTDELIRKLHTMAAKTENAQDAQILLKAADRLEELDERVAIMEEGNKIESE